MSANQKTYFVALKEQIFDKLLTEISQKPEKVLQSPRVRNEDSKEYFSISFYAMMIIIESQKAAKMSSVYQNKTTTIRGTEPSIEENVQLLPVQPVRKDAKVHYRSDLGDLSHVYQSKSQASVTTLRDV